MFYVYIITNYYATTFYVGMTGKLFNRMKQHRSKFYPKSFSAKYNVCKLVYFEEVDSFYAALKRERQLKNWHRDWKYNLVKSVNPGFKDLFGKELQKREII
ncbi:MAG: GIY-YIG nuclease family protein [bacterium]